MEKRRSALLKEHSGSPLATMLIPALTQLPLFVLMSVFFNRLCQPPFSMIIDDESFLTLTSITHTDPTAVLPIALGLITLANTESANWFLGDQVRAREERERQMRDKLRAEGKLVPPSPRNLLRAVMRVLSVGRIIIGMMAPGVRPQTIIRSNVLLIKCRLSLYTGLHQHHSVWSRPGCLISWIDGV
jgi:mitochondrial inner membrane protein COX18